MSLTPAQRDRIAGLARKYADAAHLSGRVAVKGTNADFAEALRAETEMQVALQDALREVTDFGASAPVDDSTLLTFAPFCQQCGFQVSEFTGCECGKLAVQP